MILWLSLYLPSRLNCDSIGVEDGQVVTSLHFPPDWLAVAKSYLPGAPEDLSVMAWMFDVHSGRIKVEDRIPVWGWGDKHKALDELKKALAERGIAW